MPPSRHQILPQLHHFTSRNAQVVRPRPPQLSLLLCPNCWSADPTVPPKQRPQMGQTSFYPGSTHDVSYCTSMTKNVPPGQVKILNYFNRIIFPASTPRRYHQNDCNPTCFPPKGLGSFHIGKHCEQSASIFPRCCICKIHELNTHPVDKCAIGLNLGFFPTLS